MTRLIFQIISKSLNYSELPLFYNFNNLYNHHMPGPRSSAKKNGQTPVKASVSTATPKKAKGQKYEYIELGKASLSSVEVQNVYGVIIDATFPYKANANLYVCSLKIIDTSLNGANTKCGDYATVTMYSKRFEELPIVLRCGDIIRLHRATLRMYHNRRQFNVSMHWNGSWALFSTDKLDV